MRACSTRRPTLGRSSRRRRQPGRQEAADAVRLDRYRLSALWLTLSRNWNEGRERSRVDRRTRDLEILNAIALALNATNDVRAALERTLALATDLIGLHSGWVWLLDDETNQFYSAASYNLPPYLQEPVRMSGTWCQ